MFKLTKIASAAALAAAALAPGLAQADAIGQSILDISGFTFRQGNGNATVNTNGFLSLTSPNIRNTGDTTAILTGFTTVNTPAGPTSGGFDVRSCVGGAGPCGGYTPFTPITAAPTATFVNSSSQLSGNALTPPAPITNPNGSARAITDNTVSLSPSGDGSAQGNVNLNAEFTLTLAQTTAIEINFNADSFLRAYLDQAGLASSSLNWNMTIAEVLANGNSGATVFSWAPNGRVLAGGALEDGGIEYLDAFSLNRAISVLSPGDDQRFNDGVLGANQFQAETDSLAEGTYRVTINHIARADAELVIPEPEMLSLMGIALFGAAFASRRRLGK